MKNSKCIRVLLVGVLLWTGIGHVVPGALPASGPELGGQSDPLEFRGDRIIREKAILESASYVDICSEAGELLTIVAIAREGKVVKKGDLLVELDGSSLLERKEQQGIQVEKAKARLAAAEASFDAGKQESSALVEVAEQGLIIAEGALKAFLEGEYPLQLTTAENEVIVAERRFNLVAARVGQLKKNTENQEAKNQLEEAQLALMEANAQLETANAKRRFLTEHVRDRKTAELNLAIAQKKLELIRAKNGLSEVARKGKATIAVGLASQQIELNKLTRLKGQIAACKMYAPLPGTVVYPNDAWGHGSVEAVIKPGAIVRDHQVIVRLAEMKRYKLDLQVSLQVAQRVVTGQSVTIRFDALPQRTFRGHITEVRVLSERSHGSIGGLITVRIEDPSNELKVGMPAIVELVLSQKTKEENAHESETWNPKKRCAKVAYNPVEIEILQDDRADSLDESRKQALEHVMARMTHDEQGNIADIYFGDKATGAGTDVQVEAETTKSMVEPYTKDRIKSAENLKQLCLAVLMYADDHNAKLPPDFNDLKPYLGKENFFERLLENVEYIGQGKTIQERDTWTRPIAYDKTLLEKGRGTNVAFMDGQVEYVQADRLEKIGIGKPAIQIESRFLIVSEAFLEDVGLDADSIQSDDAWSELVVAESPNSPVYVTYIPILDDLHVSFLLKAAQADPNSSLLAAPKITVLDNEKAEVKLQKKIDYVSGYSEPNRASGEPEPKHDSVTKGLELQLTPKVSPDKKYIVMNVVFELSDLLGFEEGIYKEKYPYKIPEMEIVNLITRTAIPDGGTVLIGGQKITAEEGSQKVQKELIVLIKAEIVDSKNLGTINTEDLPVLKRGYGGYTIDRSGAPISGSGGGG